MSKDINSPLMTVKEFADYIRCSEKTARKLVKQHNGFTVRFNYRIYVNRHKVDEWLDRKSC